MTVLKTAQENAQQCAAEPAAKMQRVEAPLEALRVRRLNEHALLPSRGSAGAAGYDLARCGGAGDAAIAPCPPSRRGASRPPRLSAPGAAVGHPSTPPPC